MRRQKTLRHTIGCVGVGLHSGARVGLTLRPADAGSGVRFRRVDRPRSPAIPARLDHAVGLPGATGLGAGPAAPAVRRIERLMAALAVCGIDNALIEISGPELPAMDGSAMPFVLLIECAGTVEQEAPVAEIVVLRPVEVADGPRRARLEPARGLHLDLRREGCARSFSFSSEACRRDLVAAREHVLAHEARFADEPCRHAALDALADLALLPARLHGRLVSAAADAPLRRRLLRELLATPDSWRLQGELPAGVLLGCQPGAHLHRRPARIAST